MDRFIVIDFILRLFSIRQLGDVLKHSLIKSRISRASAAISIDTRRYNLTD